MNQPVLLRRRVQLDVRVRNSAEVDPPCEDRQTARQVELVRQADDQRAFGSQRVSKFGEHRYRIPHLLQHFQAENHIKTAVERLVFEIKNGRLDRRMQTLGHLDGQRRDIQRSDRVPSFGEMRGHRTAATPDVQQAPRAITEESLHNLDSQPGAQISRPQITRAPVLIKHGTFVRRWQALTRRFRRNGLVLSHAYTHRVIIGSLLLSLLSGRIPHAPAIRSFPSCPVLTRIAHECFHGFMKSESSTRENQVLREAESSTQIRDILDAFHRMIIHYGLWQSRVEENLGLQACIELERTVWEKSFAIQMTRLAKILGFPVDPQGIPVALKDKSPEELKALLDGLSANWLANDGIWFQAVEQRRGMAAAQTCNNEAWARFSPFEAASIKATHDIPDDDPLNALSAALDGRLYAQINRYSIERPDKSTLILYMNDCRVQSTRQRKGLADYPCKSAGIIEYTTFAQAIDPRIKTECLGCPPDQHPPEWFCAWRFSL